MSGHDHDSDNANEKSAEVQANESDSSQQPVQGQGATSPSAVAPAAAGNAAVNNAANVNQQAQNAPVKEGVIAKLKGFASSTKNKIVEKGVVARKKAQNFISDSILTTEIGVKIDVLFKDTADAYNSSLEVIHSKLKDKEREALKKRESFDINLGANDKDSIGKNIELLKAYEQKIKAIKTDLTNKFNKDLEALEEGDYQKIDAKLALRIKGLIQLDKILGSGIKTLEDVLASKKITSDNANSLEASTLVINGAFLAINDKENRYKKRHSFIKATSVLLPGVAGFGSGVGVFLVPSIVNVAGVPSLGFTIGGIALGSLGLAAVAIGGVIFVAKTIDLVRIFKNEKAKGKLTEKLHKITESTEDQILTAFNESLGRTQSANPVNNNPANNKPEQKANSKNGFDVDKGIQGGRRSAILGHLSGNLEELQTLFKKFKGLKNPVNGLFQQEHLSLLKEANAFPVVEKAFMNNRFLEEALTKISLNDPQVDRNQLLPLLDEIQVTSKQKIVEQFFKTSNSMLAQRPKVIEESVTAKLSLELEAAEMFITNYYKVFELLGKVTKKPVNFDALFANNKGRLASINTEIAKLTESCGMGVATLESMETIALNFQGILENIEDLKENFEEIEKEAEILQSNAFNGLEMYALLKRELLRTFEPINQIFESSRESLELYASDQIRGKYKEFEDMLYNLNVMSAGPTFENVKQLLVENANDFKRFKELEAESKPTPVHACVNRCMLLKLQNSLTKRQEGLLNNSVSQDSKNKLLVKLLEKARALISSANSNINESQDVQSQFFAKLSKLREIQALRKAIEMSVVCYSDELRVEQVCKQFDKSSVDLIKGCFDIYLKEGDGLFGNVKGAIGIKQALEDFKNRHFPKLSGIDMNRRPELETAISVLQSELLAVRRETEDLLLKIDKDFSDTNILRFSLIKFALRGDLFYEKPDLLWRLIQQHNTDNNIDLQMSSFLGSHGGRDVGKMIQYVENIIQGKDEDVELENLVSLLVQECPSESALFFVKALSLLKSLAGGSQTLEEEVDETIIRIDWLESKGSEIQEALDLNSRELEKLVTAQRIIEQKNKLRLLESEPVENDFLRLSYEAEEVNPPLKSHFNSDQIEFAVCDIAGVMMRSEEKNFINFRKSFLRIYAECSKPSGFTLSAVIDHHDIVYRNALMASGLKDLLESKNTVLDKGLNAFSGSFFSAENTPKGYKKSLKTAEEEIKKYTETIKKHREEFKEDYEEIKTHLESIKNHKNTSNDVKKDIDYLTKLFKERIKYLDEIIEYSESSSKDILQNNISGFKQKFNAELTARLKCDTKISKDLDFKNNDVCIKTDTISKSFKQSLGMHCEDAFKCASDAIIHSSLMSSLSKEGLECCQAAAQRGTLTQISQVDVSSVGVGVTGTSR